MACSVMRGNQRKIAWRGAIRRGRLCHAFHHPAYRLQRALRINRPHFDTGSVMARRYVAFINESQEALALHVFRHPFSHN